MTSWPLLWTYLLWVLRDFHMLPWTALIAGEDWPRIWRKKGPCLCLPSGILTESSMTVEYGMFVDDLYWFTKIYLLKDVIFHSYVILGCKRVSILWGKDGNMEAQKLPLLCFVDIVVGKLWSMLTDIDWVRDLCATKAILYCSITVQICRLMCMIILMI